MKKERWGNEYKDKRSWPEYNEKLVRRYSILAPLDMICSWEAELRKMNENKIGKPFEYSNSLIKLLAYFQVIFDLPVRGIEGFARDIKKLNLIPKAPDYSQYSRRINALDWKPKEKLENVPENAVISNDSTGIKVTSFGEWRRVAHKRKRTGFLKINVVVDTKTKQILAIDVTTDLIGDITSAPKLVEEALSITSVSEYHGDSAFDSYNWFEQLTFADIKPVIPPKPNANPYRYPNATRSKVAEQYIKDPKAWRNKNNAGIRWMSETAFSIWKLLFGEHCRTKIFKNQKSEMLRKAWVYNILRNN